MIALGITAVGGGVGQALLQTLNYSQLQWRTFGMDTRPLAPGLYWSDERSLIPSVSEEEAYVQKLLSIAEEYRLDMLTPGLDIELEVLARHQSKFVERDCVVVVAETDAVRLAHDKLALYNFCRERNLPFVQSCTIEEARDVFGTNDLPVIVKPRKGKASKGVRLVYSHNELSRLENGDELIVQEYLPSPKQRKKSHAQIRAVDQTGEWSIQFFVAPDGDILGHFISVNTLKEGIPWEIVTEANADVLERARLIVEALIAKGLWGPINIQGRETDDGVVFFEANARFTGITGVRASMGYRELDAAAHLLLHGDKGRAKQSLSFNTDLVGTRHVEHTTISKRRVLKSEDNRNLERGSTPAKKRALGKVLITGATGYIGANFVRHLLKQGAAEKVLAGVRDDTGMHQLYESAGETGKLEIVTGSLPKDLWDLDGIDTVVHMAAARPTKNDTPSESTFYKINVEGTQRLIDAAIATGVDRFVFMSSQSVYGTESSPPWYESHVPSPDSSYGLSKWIAEQVLASRTSNKIDVTILRIAQVFGSGLNMRWNNFPHNLVDEAINEHRMAMYGTGDQRTDLIHVDDVCSAIMQACSVQWSSASPMTFNIGSGNTISVTDLVDVIIEKTESRGFEAPDIVRRHTDRTYSDFGMDIRRARSLLGWAPEVPLGLAIDDLLQQR